MRLTDYLDKGAQLGADAPCLTMEGLDLDYGRVQRFSHRVGRALRRSGIAPGDKVAVLSGNDAHAFACVFGISRAGAVWCPINPRNEAAENRYVLDAFDCAALIFHSAYLPMVAQMREHLPKLGTLVCLDGACRVRAARRGQGRAHAVHAAQASGAARGVPRRARDGRPRGPHVP